MDMDDNKSQKLLSELNGFMRSRKAVYPAKTGVSRMRSPQSTLGYWIRKSQSEALKTECTADLVFAKLPTEQELQFHSPAGSSSITILLPENIRIEVGADCLSRLIAALLQALKNYA